MALLNCIIPSRGSRRELARRDDPFNYLRSQLNRVFDDALTGNWPAETETIFTPRLDVTETEKEVKVCVELPGIESKDLDVNVTDDELTIRGEKHSERGSDEKGRQWTEQTYGHSSAPSRSRRKWMARRRRANSTTACCASLCQSVKAQNRARTRST
jgi:HSP20 family protein